MAPSGKNARLRKSGLPLLLLLAGLFAAGEGLAQTRYWDGPANNTTSIESGEGDWDLTTANWTTVSGTPNSVWTQGSTPHFTGSSSFTVKLNINAIIGGAFTGCVKNTPFNPAPADAVLCSASPATTPVDAANTLVQWRFTGTLNANQSGTVSYIVRVNSN